MKTKRCFKCGKVKPVSEFSPRTDRNSYRSYCKQCANKLNIERLKTKEGVISRIYFSQKQSSIRRGHPLPLYSKDELLHFALNSEQFNSLYDNWVKSGYKSEFKPSFDRYDDYKGYSFENFNKWMTWKENDNKGKRDRKNGINNKTSTPIFRIDIKTNEHVYFPSIGAGARSCNGRSGNILKVINGEINKSYNYKWERALL